MKLLIVLQMLFQVVESVAVLAIGFLVLLLLLLFAGLAVRTATRPMGVK